MCNYKLVVGYTKNSESLIYFYIKDSLINTNLINGIIDSMAYVEISQLKGYGR